MTRLIIINDEDNNIIKSYDDTKALDGLKNGFLSQVGFQCEITHKETSKDLIKVWVKKK